MTTQIVKGFKKNLLFLKIDNQDYFFKYSRLNQSNHRIKNEVKVYKILNDKKFSYFDYSKLAIYGDSYFMSTVLKRDSCNDIDINFSRAIKEFNFSIINSRRIRLNRFLLDNIYLRFIILSITLYYKRIIRISHLLYSIKVLLNIIISKGYKKKFLIHKDLKLGKNNFVTQDKKLGLFDFELTKVTKKLFLLDIIDFSYNLDDFSMNYDIVIDYLNLINEFEISFSKLKSQIMFLQLRLHFHSLRHKNMPYKNNPECYLNKLIKSNFYLKELRDKFHFSNLQ